MRGVKSLLLTANSLKVVVARRNNLQILTGFTDQSPSFRKQKEIYKKVKVF